MKILYIDIDTLRPDHLGCYGYSRGTSPNIDALAARSARFTNVHASDVPCLPSRTALLTGRFGINNGVVNHGGTDADPVIDGADRGFWSSLQRNSFPSRLGRAGLRTASISSFAQRHSAFHWYAGFDEALNVGKYGFETADEVYALAADWLRRNGQQDSWFLHVHLWDPHTPYRATDEYFDALVHEPIPSWLNEDVRLAHWQGCGPHSAQESNGFAPRENWAAEYPRQPQQVPDMAGVRQMFDGYDAGVLMADDYVGRLLNLLADLKLDNDTMIWLSSDHGETLGELNVYGDHQTADQITTRVPFLWHWPGKFEAGVYTAKHYQFDLAATLLELMDVRVPGTWDATSFAADLKQGRDVGRDYLVLSQGAWACQRGVRVDDWLYLATRHDAYHLYPDEMLFDVESDPHLQQDLLVTSHSATSQAKNGALGGALSAPQIEQALTRCRELLAQWQQSMLPGAARGRDPHVNVMQEGGPFHVRGELPDYLQRLRETGARSPCGSIASTLGKLVMLAHSDCRKSAVGPIAFRHGPCQLMLQNNGSCKLSE